MTQTTTSQTAANPDRTGRTAVTDRTDAVARLPAANVTSLYPREPMAFDQARLAEVCDAHGQDAEAYIACILDEVEIQVTAAAAASRAAEPGALARACRDIATLSDAIGMVTMWQAAQAVLEGVATGADDATRSACLYRLLRLGRPAETGGWKMSRGPGPDTVA